MAPLPRHAQQRCHDRGARHGRCSISPPASAPTSGRACHEAWHRHRTTPAEIEACIARNPHKKGIAKLRRALGSDVVLSPLEVRFRRLMREHGLPSPRTNIDMKGDKVDCHSPEHGLTVELYSYRFHESRHAFENDLARRRRSSHVPFSWGDVFERGPRTATEIARLLARASGARSSTGVFAGSDIRPSPEARPQPADDGR